MERDILNKLIEQGKITKEDIENADESLLLSDRRIAISRIHSLCCKEDHNTVCTWYEEENNPKGNIEYKNTDIFHLPSHAEWVSITLELKKTYNLNWNEIGLVSELIGKIPSNNILLAITKLISMYNLTSQ